MIGRGGYSNTTNKTPVPGDLFTISGANSNHKKAYMVTRVETSADYETGTTQPASTQVRIHFTPGLARSIVTGDDFVFHNPLIKVILDFCFFDDTSSVRINGSSFFVFSLGSEISSS